MKNFIQKGDVINVTLGATVASGAVVKAGSVIGIAQTSGVSGDVIAVSVEGVFNVPKLSTDNMTQGSPLYWDAANSRMTLTSAGHTLAGYAWETAGASTTTVNIRLLF